MLPCRILTTALGWTVTPDHPRVPVLVDAASSELVSARWARQFRCCQQCGTRERPHRSRGLCGLCYERWNEERHRPRLRGDNVDAKLSREYLLQEYVTKGRSLLEIAGDVGCTRQHVHARLRAFGIPSRSLGAARILALERGKLRGQQRQHVNSAFFDSWSPEMAWVLGVIATDGCLRAPGTDRRTGRRVQGFLAITQKEPELLRKVTSLMGSTATIRCRPAHCYGGVMAGRLHYVHIHDQRLFDALLRLGITPRKSRTLAFPDVPAPFLRHFIRGCWDGDGSITVKGSGLACSFTSASRQFVTALVEHLGCSRPR